MPHNKASVLFHTFFGQPGDRVCLQGKKRGIQGSLPDADTLTGQLKRPKLFHKRRLGKDVAAKESQQHKRVWRKPRFLQARQTGGSEGDKSGLRRIRPGNMKRKIEFGHRRPLKTLKDENHVAAWAVLLILEIRFTGQRQTRFRCC